jgi:hypothetical protein
VIVNKQGHSGLLLVAERGQQNSLKRTVALGTKNEVM